VGLATGVDAMWLLLCLSPRQVLIQSELKHAPRGKL
jgi:hypothetical protein